MALTTIVLAGGDPSGLLPLARGDVGSISSIPSGGFVQLSRGSVGILSAVIADEGDALLLTAPASSLPVLSLATATQITATTMRAQVTLAYP